MPSFSDACLRPGDLRVGRVRRNPPVLALRGELDLATVRRPIDAVADILDRPPVGELIVLDLTGLTFMAAAGIRMLLAAQDHAAARRVGLRIVTGGNPVVERCLRAAGVGPALAVHPDVPSALEAGATAWVANP